MTPGVGLHNSAHLPGLVAGPEKVGARFAASFFVRAPVLPNGEKPDTLPEGALLDLVRL